MADLLPANATPLERNIAAVNARLGELPVPLRELTNPDACPVDKLPWLASYMSVDSWNLDLSESQKRESIKSSISVHRVKGTIGAVRRSLASLGFQARLQEWFNQVPAAPAYTYRLLLDVDQVGVDRRMLTQVAGMVEATKNLRSHMTDVVLAVTSTGTVSVGAVACVGTEMTVTYGGPSDFGLLFEGYANGDEQTEAAAIALDKYLNQSLPMKWKQQ
jgi:phage tail P2-like protein